MVRRARSRADRSTTDVENIVIGAANGTPIYVRNVAAVKIGEAFRVGALDKDGKEAVGGVVIARYGVERARGDRGA